MLIWMKKCLCKQACNTLSHSNQRMAETVTKIPYDTVMTADFADSECEASAKSCYSARAWSARVL